MSRMELAIATCEGERDAHHMPAALVGDLAMDPQEAMDEDTLIHHKKITKKIHPWKFTNSHGNSHGNSIVSRNFTNARDVMHSEAMSAPPPGSAHPLRSEAIKADVTDVLRCRRTKFPIFSTPVST